MIMLAIVTEDNNDMEVITTIYTSLMAAEKVAKVLDIELIADTEVSDDLFMFSLKSQEQKELALKMFDEEGYELAADRIIQVQDGNNYNALNVKSLSDGTYKFVLTDDSGAEKVATVRIAR